VTVSHVTQDGASLTSVLLLSEARLSHRSVSERQASRVTIDERTAAEQLRRPVSVGRKGGHARYVIALPTVFQSDTVHDAHGDAVSRRGLA